jgi:beta-1,4-mannosyltransferase
VLAGFCNLYALCGLHAQYTDNTRVVSPGGVELHPNRPALIISSTSWTPDEDFGILLDALIALDKAWSSGQLVVAADAQVPSMSTFPSLVVVVTGKGPERAMYEAKFALLNLRYVTIKTMWLEQSDYPLLLVSDAPGIVWKDAF